MSLESEITPFISMMPTFSPKSKLVFREPRIKRRGVPMMTIARMDEKIRTKKRNGCLRENMTSIYTYSPFNFS
jgi:hypothetical protein